MYARPNLVTLLQTAVSICNIVMIQPIACPFKKLLKKTTPSVMGSQLSGMQQQHISAIWIALSGIAMILVIVSSRLAGHPEIKF